MKIYTGRGDEGKTDLRGGHRVEKTSPRVEAYGTVDEVNAVVGLAYPTGYDDVDGWLGEIQNHLHVVQASFSTPDADVDTPRIRDEHVEQLEAWIDAADEELEPLGSFVFPGGSEAGSRLHHARTVCRRAERRAVALAADGSDDGSDAASCRTVDEAALAYLNRLSDAFFTFARLLNEREGVEERSPTY